MALEMRVEFIRAVRNKSIAVSIFPPLYKFYPTSNRLLDRTRRCHALCDLGVGTQELTLFIRATFAAELLISINEFLISIKMDASAIFIYINK